LRGRQMKFGAMLYQSSGTISAVEFARIAEQCGCDSVWLGEHTHRPVTDDERPLMKQGDRAAERLACSQ